MKRLIKFIRFFALFYISMFFLGYGCLNCNKEFRLIKKAVLSNEFTEHFAICNKKNDTIFVFNDSKDNLGLAFLRSNTCFKVINFSKINFKYDVNSIMQKNKGIVFIGIEKNIVWSQLLFFDLETNLSLKLKYDLNERLIDVNVGNF